MIDATRLREEIMKILRPVIRRGFSVGSAGYFTVLRPNTWFAASHFPDRFPNLHERDEAVVRQPAQELTSSAAANQMTIHLDLKPPAEPLRLMRLALIVMLAIGITVFAFWWIFVRPHTVY